MYIVVLVWSRGFPHLSGLMEFPSYVIAIVLLEFVGRRIPLVIFQLTSALACLAMILVPQSKNTHIICPVSQNFDLFLSLFRPRCPSYSSVTPWQAGSVGQFLHRVRVLGWAVTHRCSHACCRLRLDVRSSGESPLTFHRITGTSTVLPVVTLYSVLFLLQGNTWRPFPSLVFGSVALAAAVLALLLPETRNRRLPETMQDGEDFGRWRHKIFSYFQQHFEWAINRDCFAGNERLWTLPRLPPPQQPNSDLIQPMIRTQTYYM